MQESLVPPGVRLAADRTTQGGRSLPAETGKGLLMSRWHVVLLAALVASFTAPARGETVFVEAEAFTPSSDGWAVSTGPETRAASGMTTLHGAAGAGDATASKTITLKEAGHYRVWVRFRAHPTYRGPFQVAVLTEGRAVATHVFDREPDRDATKRNDFVWKFLTADLPAGDVVLRLSKHDQKNSSAPARHVDCFLLTTDPKLVPDHTAYGRQTYLRVTVGDGYDRPVYLHVFADHYRAPWYKHFAVARNGVTAGVVAKKADLLKAGERTAWCNITPMLYQDSGARLQMSIRFAYTEPAPRLRATLEFASAPDDQAIVRTVRADCQPNGLVVVVPPDLTTPENRSRLKTDRELADETGKLADAFDWPKFGKPPEQFPFMVRAKIDGGDRTMVDAAVTAREQKTLDYFGFTPAKGRVISGGIWYPTDGSFCRPDVGRMKTQAALHAAEFKAQGRSAKNILCCRLTDEPTGQPASFLATDPAAAEAFRTWLKGMGKTPADLLVADWAAVRPVIEAQAKEFPALHYYTQRFRTRALGDFMATQRKILEEAYGASFPVLANFSDGAVYHANFYSQGVDYFELLDAADGQNAIWGEDWANGSSTYQCAAFNVDLMRAAARRGQPIGHFLISYAGRTPWDAKLKAVGELARGVKMLESFHYGPTWSGHEGGPPWKSSAWSTKPEMWRAQAELLREVGAAEDLLVPAMPAPAEVAILYSSASDVWTAKGNLAYGFDRMHTWLALAHAHVPVDILSEANVAAGRLAGYRVCYLSGPNLTRAAAGKLADWVRAGGTLWLTAGAAARDEYDQPLTTLDDFLPARRAAAVDAKPHRASGRYLQSLKAEDEVTMAAGGKIEVLSVRQGLDPRPEVEVLGRYKDGSAALVRGAAGKGSVYCAGFLPALAYIKAAQVARAEAGDRDRDLLARSLNPWAFPPGVRDLLLRPVQAAGVNPPLKCDVPVVDAVYMIGDRGVVVPLANYTLRPIDRLSLTVRADRPVSRVESARRGPLPFTSKGKHEVVIALPLEATDFVKLYLADPE